MMMMGEGVHVPPWSHLPVSGIDAAGAGDEVAPYLLAALRQYLPSNEVAGGDDDEEAVAAAAVDAYACDEFRMYEFKVRRCARGRSHDWTECPFAHPGEKARRRDPRKYHYSGTACPDFRKGGCKRGDGCEYAHGVFECWLHPARYRTQPCKDGTACRRRVCFFAHTPDQLRILPPQQHQQLSPRSAASSPVAESYDGSPLRRQAVESYLTKSLMSSSPTSTLMSPPKSPPSESPPLSPNGGASGGAFRRGSWSAVGSPVSDVLASLRQLRLNKSMSAPSGGWSSYPATATAFGSPKSTGIYSLPTTPTRASPATAPGSAGVEPRDLGLFTRASPATAPGSAGVEPRDLGLIEEEPVERVESGRALREKVFERLSKEGTVAGGSDGSAVTAAPDVGWVSELVN